MNSNPDAARVLRGAFQNMPHYSLRIIGAKLLPAGEEILKAWNREAYVFYDYLFDTHLRRFGLEYDTMDRRVDGRTFYINSKLPADSAISFPYRDPDPNNHPQMSAIMTQLSLPPLRGSPLALFYAVVPGMNDELVINAEMARPPPTRTIALQLQDRVKATAAQIRQVVTLFCGHTVLDIDMRDGGVVHLRMDSAQAAYHFCLNFEKQNELFKAHLSSFFAPSDPVYVADNVKEGLYDVNGLLKAKNHLEYLKNASEKIVFDRLESEDDIEAQIEDDFSVFQELGEDQFPILQLAKIQTQRVGIWNEKRAQQEKALQHPASQRQSPASRALSNPTSPRTPTKPPSAGTMPATPRIVSPSKAKWPKDGANAGSPTASSKVLPRSPPSQSSPKSPSTPPHLPALGGKTSSSQKSPSGSSSPSSPSKKRKLMVYTQKDRKETGDDDGADSDVPAAKRAKRTDPQ
eukprot:TRINITY_DN1280_c0_g1_i1.p1 TRINITY_DN1280_c0_g1~~TRINITY_DN1280_c0_g1_i1.p1  ORF type:complete len:461 (+),score=74.63 TRINITY_DN1280_c0_g1_i1:775-2157(+)